MTYSKIITVVIFGIAFILFALDIIREIITYRDIKSNFYCKHCNTFNKEISGISKCKKCSRTFKIKDCSWYHFILNRNNWISTNSKTENFQWKEYRKLSLIEITIGVISAIVLITEIAIIILKY